MGSPLRLTVVGPGAERAWSVAVDEFAESDRALSKFRDDADLVALDRVAGTGIAWSVGRRLERAMVIAERARRVTGGRFDPRVLDDLERLGEHGATLGSGSAPSSGDRGWRDRPVMRRSSPGYLSIERPVDLGGLGKGLALRWSTARIEASGLRDFLLDAGGDIVVRGRAPEGGRWRIGIEHPSDPQHGPLAVIGLTDLAVATSSIRRRRWDRAGTTVHHLIDPATGGSAWNGLLAVTVAAPDPAWAEVWSKTLFLTGPRKIGFEARRRHLAAWWMADDATLEMTPAAREITMWVAGEPSEVGVGQAGI
jgi:thiamine biosynthesis lipoprotein